MSALFPAPPPTLVLRPCGRERKGKGLCAWEGCRSSGPLGLVVPGDGTLILKLG